MGRPIEDITGLKIGYMTAIKIVGSYIPVRKPIWLIQCVCGNTVTCNSSAYKGRQYQSCGCMRNKLISQNTVKHGMSHHPLYSVWDTMIARCHRKSHKSNRRYSARGITVCEAWRKSFIAFRDDMVIGYAKGLQLDRIDNAKGYSKENCRWATTKQQANNTSYNIKINTPDGQMNVCEAADKYGIKRTTLLNRIKSGWPEDKWFIKVSYANKIKENKNGCV